MVEPLLLKFDSGFQTDLIYHQNSCDETNLRAEFSRERHTFPLCLKITKKCLILRHIKSETFSVTFKHCDIYKIHHVIFKLLRGDEKWFENFYFMSILDYLKNSSIFCSMMKKSSRSLSYRCFLECRVRYKGFSIMNSR